MCIFEKPLFVPQFPLSDDNTSTQSYYCVNVEEVTSGSQRTVPAKRLTQQMLIIIIVP